MSSESGRTVTTDFASFDLGDGARPTGPAFEALNKRIEAMSAKAERDFVQCFGARAAKEPGWGAVVKLTKELVAGMRER